MQLIPYRDSDGYIIVKRRVRLGVRRHSQKDSGGARLKAELVYCPETEGLVHVKICEGCPKFIGHAIKRQCLKCQTNKAIDAGEYYDSRTIYDKRKSYYKPITTTKK